ncbi:MAG: hypothetical protein RL548_1306 [Bacteroidota bacterium]
MGNISFQGVAYWDDIEKLEHILQLLKLGYNMDDEFQFVDENTLPKPVELIDEAQMKMREKVELFKKNN